MTAPVRVCLCHGAPCGESKRRDTLYCSISKRRLEGWRVVSAASVRPLPNQTIADNPNRRKRCTGACGQVLPATAFYANGRGYPTGPCKPCRRITQREQVRRRYHADPEYREAKIAKDRERHQADKERLNAERRARYRAQRARMAEAHAAAQ